MIVYLVWYGVQVTGVFSTWEKASQCVDEQVAALEKESGYHLMSDFSISAEEVR